MGSGASTQTNRQVYESLIQKINICYLSQIPSTSSSRNNDYKIYLGRVITPSMTPLYSPLSHLSCVYYIITVEVYYDDDASYHIVGKKEKQQSFYLIHLEDRVYSLYVPALNTPNIKLVGKTSIHHSFNDSNRPLLYKILNSHNVDIHRFPEDKLRLKEDILTLGEVVGIFGEIGPPNNINGTSKIHEVFPISAKDIDSTWYNNHTFTQSDIDDWSRLLSTSQYLCTDDPTLMKGMMVNPLPPNFDFSYVIPGYNHQLMGTSHKNPSIQGAAPYQSMNMMPIQQLQQPIQQPIPIQQSIPIQQPMIHQQYAQSQVQQPVPMHSIPIQSGNVLSMMQQTMMMASQAVANQQQMSHHPIMTHAPSHQYLHQNSNPYPASPQYPAPQQTYTPSPVNQQYPQQYPPMQSTPYQPQMIQSHSQMMQPQQYVQTSHNTGYYPTQQPVQHHPGGYPQDPQYGIPMVQSSYNVPVATQVYYSK